MTTTIENIKPNDKILIFDRVFNVRKIIKDLIDNNKFVKLICYSSKTPNNELIINRQIGTTIIKIKE